MRKICCVLVLVLAGSHPCSAASYPAKSLRLIVPFPPGGSTDVVARLLVERLGAQLGQHVIVDNRAGARGNLGSEIVARADAD